MPFAVDALPEPMAHFRTTRPGRLDHLTKSLEVLCPELCSPTAFGGAPVVDLGIGRAPWTTVELANRWRPVPVVGLDHADDVVRGATAFERENLSFRVGSFVLPVRARLVRVMNVLRDMGAREAAGELAALRGRVVDGGWVVEGNCSVEGATGVVQVLQEVGGAHVLWGVVCWADGRRGTAPAGFVSRLPVTLRGNEVLARRLDDWMRAYRAASGDRLAVSAEQVGVRRLTSVAYLLRVG